MRDLTIPSCSRCRTDSQNAHLALIGSMRAVLSQVRGPNGVIEEAEQECEALCEALGSPSCSSSSSLSLPSFCPSTQIPGGYLVKSQGGELKYMLAFACPEVRSTAGMF